jgi:lipopolysaccharide heptosyltransferase I
MTPLPGDPKRVLIIKPSAIGDVVHTLPILNLVRRKWPAAHIAWLVTPPCAGLLDGHPQLDEVILFDRKRLGGAWKSIGRFLELRRFARSLRERAFDLVLDLQGLFRSGWLAKKTRAPVRVGFANAREFAPMFYTHRVPIDTMEQHAIERYLKLAKFAGCGVEVEYVFATDENDRTHVRKLLQDRAAEAALPYAVLLPGTNWATKRLPVETFAALVAPLRERLRLRAVVAGSAADGEFARAIPDAIDLTGKTNLRQLTALLEQAALVIANDSGPMHIAAALNRPLVTVFGPTNPIRTGPHRRDHSVLRLDIPCTPCYSRVCSHQSCLRWISPDAVLELAASQMGR